MKPLIFLSVAAFAVAMAVILFPESSARAEEVFVQSAKAQLRAEPKMSAGSVAELSRGDSLEVIRKDGLWYEVKRSSKQGRVQGQIQGWISKLFVNSHRPVGAADLNQDVQQSLEKASRQRSSAYAVSASTRGLAASERIREGRELYAADFDGLKRMEELAIPQPELDMFRKSANLSE